MNGTMGTRLKTRVLEAARENGEAMWRQTTLSVAGDKRAEVTSVVQRYFATNRRFGIVEWAEPGRVIAVSTRGNLWSGGEAIEVRVSEGVDSSTTQVQVLSVLSAMYDWGKNRRNIEDLLSYLLNAAIDFETTTTNRKYEFGGPLELEFRGPV